jgi:hypothetical protein
MICSVFRVPCLVEHNADLKLTKDESKYNDGLGLTRWTAAKEEWQVKARRGAWAHE